MEEKRIRKLELKVEGLESIIRVFIEKFLPVGSESFIKSINNLIEQKLEQEFPEDKQKSP